MVVDLPATILASMPAGGYCNQLSPLFPKGTIYYNYVCNRSLAGFPGTRLQSDPKKCLPRPSPQLAPQKCRNKEEKKKENKWKANLSGWLWYNVRLTLVDQRPNSSADIFLLCLMFPLHFPIVNSERIHTGRFHAGRFRYGRRHVPDGRFCGHCNAVAGYASDHPLFY
uniref:Uncharacterized protein n=1 Tax=Glossina pallidipes TaxID=7398 RepID=A0A1B0A572_GLOPL